MNSGKNIAKYFIRLWNALWDSTNIDEKAKDVINAAKGNKRRGKKPIKNKKKTKTNNKTKK